MHPWGDSLPGTERHAGPVPRSGSLRLPRPGQPWRPSTPPAQVLCGSHGPGGPGACPQARSPGRMCAHTPASGVRSRQEAPRGLLLIHRILWSAFILLTVQLAQGSVRKLCLPDFAPLTLLSPAFLLDGENSDPGLAVTPRLGCFLPEGPGRVFSLLVAILNCTRCGCFSTRSALISTFDLEMWVSLQLAGGTLSIIIS